MILTDSTRSPAAIAWNALYHGSPIGAPGSSMNNLSYPEERVTEAHLSELPNLRFDCLWVLVLDVVT